MSPNVIDQVSINSLYSKSSRHKKQLQRIPEKSKMFIFTLGYDIHPTNEELNLHIRQFIIAVKKERIKSFRFKFREIKKPLSICPFLEFQPNYGYMPHWHVLMNSHVNNMIITSIWRKIAGIKSRNIVIMVYEVDPKYLNLYSKYCSNPTPVNAVINYCTKVKKGNQIVKMSPDRKYKFRNTYVKAFAEAYENISIKFNLYDETDTDFKNVLCEVTFSRTDVKIKINDRHPECFKYRRLLQNILSHYEFLYAEKIRKKKSSSHKSNTFQNSQCAYIPFGPRYSLHCWGGIDLIRALIAKDPDGRKSLIYILYRIRNEILGQTNKVDLRLAITIDTYLEFEILENK